jgi:hypothetical protein
MKTRGFVLPLGEAVLVPNGVELCSPRRFRPDRNLEHEHEHEWDRAAETATRSAFLKKDA